MPDLSTEPTWTISNAALQGGGAITGSFQFDLATLTLLNYNIEVAGDFVNLGDGKIDYYPGQDFSPVPFETSIYDISANSFGVSQNPTPFFPALLLTFSSPLDPSEGTVEFSAAYFDLASGPVTDANEEGGTGYATPSPEPGFAFMTLAISAGVLTIRLRTRIRADCTDRRSCGLLERGWAVLAARVRVGVSSGRGL